MDPRRAPFGALAPFLGALALLAGCGASFPPQENIVVRRPFSVYGQHLEQPRLLRLDREPSDAPPEVDGLRPADCQALCSDVLPGRTVLSCRTAVLAVELERIDPSPPAMSGEDRSRFQGLDPNEWILCSFTPAPPSASNPQETPR